MKNILLLLLVAITFTSCSEIISNKEIEEMDSKNEGVNIVVKYKSIFNQKTIVFDIKSISGTNSALDVFRAFLQSANKLTDKSFDKVEFACKGVGKMYIDGSYFKTLGSEYGEQNVIYTIRTFPENVKLMDGTAAFSEWTGGWIGVATKQMEDFNEFHKKWYLSELVGD